jgi:hypothetical protein
VLRGGGGGVSVFLPLLVLPNAFKQISLLQISSILSQFLLVLSFLVLKNSQVSDFHLEGHFLGVSKLHYPQSSSGFCKRLSFFVVAGFLSTNCVQENKENRLLICEGSH